MVMLDLYFNVHFDGHNFGVTNNILLENTKW